MNSFMKKFKLNSRGTRLILIAVVIAIAYLADKAPGPKFRVSGAASMEQVIADQLSDVQVSGTGTVVKLLADDNQGSRHQRFLLRLKNGHVILVAHNIDLAPRLNSLREGTRVSFYGEFEWNEKGGVVHWTHRDPNGNHPHGWLEYHGEKYQ
jgi:hypothetical protein